MHRKHLGVLLLCIVLVGFVAGIQPTPYRFPELRFFPPMHVNTENPTTMEGVRLGRYLFYDPILSSDSSMSCASCHKQAFAFSDGGKSLSKGVNGELTKRHTMPLFNLAWYSAYFWDGRVASLEEQAFQPVRQHNELNLSWAEAASRIQKNKFYRYQFAQAFPNQRIDSVLIVKALAQFERTLISNRSKYDRMIARTDYFTPEEANGFVLVNDMTKGDCMHCHITDGNALGTTGRFSNNGLDAVFDATAYRDAGRGAITNTPSDQGLFKIPSLRNVALTAPYMHDGRFATLEDVIRFYSTGVHASANVDSKMGTVRNGGAHLTETEQRAIIAFLKTLSDSAFITDTCFQNPWPIHR